MLICDTPLLPPWPNVMLCHLKEEFYSRTLKKIFATSYKLVGGNVINFEWLERYH